MVRTRLPPAERRELILVAARRAFTSEGFDGASMRQIAIDSGVTTPVLYDHFPSKRALYLHILEEEADALTQATASVASAATLGESLAIGVEVFFEFIEQRPHAWRLLMRDIPRDPEIGERHRELQRRGDRAIARALARATRQGPGDPRDAEIAEARAVAVRSMVNGLANWWWDHPELPRATMTAIATQLLTHGIRAST